MDEGETAEKEEREREQRRKFADNMYVSQLVTDSEGEDDDDGDDEEFQAAFDRNFDVNFDDDDDDDDDDVHPDVFESEDNFGPEVNRLNYMLINIVQRAGL